MAIYVGISKYMICNHSDKCENKLTCKHAKVHLIYNHLCSEICTAINSPKYLSCYCVEKLDDWDE
jgi:hypothetical protein